MKLLVLGAGLQGCACAYDLLQNPAITQVTLADHRRVKLPQFLAGDWGGRLCSIQLDVTDRAAVQASVSRSRRGDECDPLLLQRPHGQGGGRGGCHFSDLGGNTEIVFEQKKLHDARWRRAFRSFRTAASRPGMVNILAAEGIRRLDQAEQVKIFVGGLPQHPEPPLNYQIVYSLEGALDYYTTPSWVLRGGKPVQVDALSELEAVEFPSPVGTLEAFHTGGGISTMPFAYEGKIDVMEYKTLRYPGPRRHHAPDPRAGAAGQRADRGQGQEGGAARCVHRGGAAQAYKPEGRDLVALQVQVTGHEGREAGGGHLPADRLLRCRARHQRDDAHHRVLALDHGPDAGGRPGKAKGVHTPDEAMPFEAYVAELGRSGVRIEEL